MIGQSFSANASSADDTGASPPAKKEKAVKARATKTKKTPGVSACFS